MSNARIVVSMIGMGTALTVGYLVISELVATLPVIDQEMNTSVTEFTSTVFAGFGMMSIGLIVLAAFALMSVLQGSGHSRSYRTDDYSEDYNDDDDYDDDDEDPEPSDIETYKQKLRESLGQNDKTATLIKAVEEPIEEQQEVKEQTPEITPPKEPVRESKIIRRGESRVRR